MAPRKPPTQPPATAPYLGADRATAPMGVEQNSESAWARFEELQKAFEAGLDTTDPKTPAAQPVDASSPAYAATEPMDVAPRAAPASPAARAITLDQLMLLARRNNRACPVPAQWAAFYRLLPARVLEGGRRAAAPAPVDGPAWASTSAMQKRLRLRDQLEWADRAGVLTEVGAFLVALPEQDWHHFDD